MKYFCFQGDIAIDDVARLTVSCTEPNNCDFEGDTFCGWENEEKTDEFDWEITSGPSDGSYATGKNKRKSSFNI